MNRLIAAGAALTCVAAPVAGQQVAHLSATQMFALADAALNQGRPSEAETIYRALARDPDLEIRTEARFRLGQMLAAAGRKREAATVYRALLDEKPQAPRVRLELARLLAELGDARAAGRELRHAQAAGLPPDVARVVDQFATALRSSQPYGATVEIALAPDTNVNRATDRRTLDTVVAPLDLSRDARARSGVGVRLAGQAFARVPLSERLALLPRLSGDSRVYREGDFNDVSTGVQLGLERSNLAGARVTASGGQSWRWYGDRRYGTTTTGSLDLLKPMGRTAQLVANLSAGRARYRLNDLQDGWLLDTSVGYERALGTRGGGSLSFGLTRQTARDPGYASWSGGPTALIYRDVGRATMFGSVTLRRLEGDVRLFLFPDRRREWLARVGLGATFRQLAIRGLAPVARVTVERNRSTVGLYDYRRLAFEIGLSRAF